MKFWKNKLMRRYSSGKPFWKKIFRKNRIVREYFWKISFGKKCFGKNPFKKNAFGKVKSDHSKEYPKNIPRENIQR
jgi:hypothetical protein